MYRERERGAHYSRYTMKTTRLESADTRYTLHDAFIVKRVLFPWNVGYYTLWSMLNSNYSQGIIID